MTTSPEEQTDLAARVVALERSVEALESRLAAIDARSERLAPRPAPVIPPPSALASPQAPREALPPRRPTLGLLPAEPGQWVNYLGIALLLLGAAFGFKYSIDRGWIGPAVRVGFGIGLGVALLALSAWLGPSRRALSRVLAGGGIACGYLSVYAAFQLYFLIPQGAAFAAMSVVTAIAFVVGMRGDDAVTATIGAVGGLATPFLLHTSGGNVAGLVGYTCLVVTGAAAVFAASGWRSLLWVAAIGGWVILAGAAEQSGQASGDGGVLQGGILFVALATWWLSVVRETFSEEDPATWRPTTPGLTFGFEPPLPSQAGDWVMQPHQLTVATPVLVLLVSSAAWKLEEVPAGWAAITLAAGWSMAGLHLGRLEANSARRLATTHFVAAAVMVAFAMSFLLGDDVRRIGFAAEALALLVLARHSGSAAAATLGHLLFALVAFLTLGRMLDAVDDGRGGFHLAEAADLAVVALLGAAGWTWSSSGGAPASLGRTQASIGRTQTSIGRSQASTLRSAYLVAAQVGLLVWLLNVLGPMTGGAALVTASWFTNAVVLVVAGLRLDSAPLRSAGAAVMALTMGKLFAFDMATVDAGWRIVTFLAFGAVLLGLGYAFPALWKRAEAEGTGARATEPGGTG
ncbi:MAG: DUF2339 domain-containing protein [Candidatus Binatia bacterium]